MTIEIRFPGQVLNHIVSRNRMNELKLHYPIYERKTGMLENWKAETLVRGKLVAGT